MLDTYFQKKKIINYQFFHSQDTQTLCDETSNVMK